MTCCRLPSRRIEGRWKLRTGMRRRIPATPASTWRLIGSFGDLAAWMPGVAGVRVHGSGPGSVRLCETVKGIFEERLEKETARSHEYTILSGDLGVRNYRARLSVWPADDPGCAIVFWLARFDPAPGVSAEEARRTVQALHRAGLNAIERHFAGA